MNSGSNDNLQRDLQVITDAISARAADCRGDTLALLQLLRRLEALHREIREGLFQESLPDNRQALYSLVKDIEAEGGWPYINRMKLRDLLVHMTGSSPSEADSTASQG